MPLVPHFFLCCFSRMIDGTNDSLVNHSLFGKEMKFSFLPFLFMFFVSNPSQSFFAHFPLFLIRITFLRSLYFFSVTSFFTFLVDSARHLSRIWYMVSFILINRINLLRKMESFEQFKDGFNIKITLLKAH